MKELLHKNISTRNPQRSRQTVCGIPYRTNVRHRESKILPLFLLRPLRRQRRLRRKSAREKFRKLFLVSQRNHDIELKSNNTGGFCQRAHHHRRQNTAVISQFYRFTRQHWRARNALSKNRMLSLPSKSFVYS